MASTAMAMTDCRASCQGYEYRPRQAAADRCSGCGIKGDFREQVQRCATGERGIMLDFVFCRYKRAARALKKEDESLAKEALKRRKAFAVRHVLVGDQAGAIQLCQIFQ